ncbi:MAG: AI-2E family transporter [Ginsengibacter sp.]
MVSFNNRLRQIILLSVIFIIGILLLKHLYIFFPGVLGAITLHILSRESYLKLTDKQKWSKGWTALLYIIVYSVLICLPIYLAIVLISPKLISLFNNPVEIMVAVKTFSGKIQHAIGLELLSTENVKNTTRNLANKFPVFLTSTANIVGNLLIMFFLLYYTLIYSKKIENFLEDFIPLKHTNLAILGTETKVMIKSNAIGIPLLAIIQGFTGALGYWIFGVNEVLLWGFITAVCSVIPIVGTGLVWVPLTIYLLAINHTWQGFGLALYSLVILTNIDYVARITVLRKIGDVHPLITIFGVIAGLSMFGFLGLIFGPLLISYFILLVKIYRNEFNATPITPLHIEKTGKEIQSVNE